MSRELPANWRQLVAERAHGLCEYCRSSAKYALQSFESEHIQPLAEGGSTTLDNLAWACGGCNRCKGARMAAVDPDSGQVVALYNPRQQRWSDHFAWDSTYSLVVGLTAVGRATVAALRLNRQGVVNLRRLLIPLGEHPPHP